MPRCVFKGRIRILILLLSLLCGIRHMVYVVNVQNDIIGPPSTFTAGPKIAVQIVNINTSWWKDVVALENHKSYCQKWGYSCRVFTKKLDPSRVPQWQKLRATLELFETEGYDYVMWMDGDAMFANCEVSLTTMLQQMEAENTSWLFSGDTLAVNSGQMIFRNTEAAKNILRTINELYYPSSIKMYDNRAIAAYLGGAVSRKNGAHSEASFKRGYEAADQCYIHPDSDLCNHIANGNKKHALGFVDENILRHISYVPQRAINSYTANYQPGDFIFHCAGQPDKKRCLASFLKKYGRSSIKCS